MVHRCTVRRNTPTDTAGKITTSWADLTTDQRCLIQEGAGQYRQTTGGRTVEYDAIGFFPRDVDLRPRGGNPLNDVILMTSPPWLAGNTYLVQLVVDECGMGDHATAYLQLKAPG